MSRAAAVLLVAGFLSTTQVRAQPGAPPLPKPAARRPAPRLPATRQLLRELASGTQPLADLIDPAVGLLFVDHFEGPGEDGNTIEDLHVCPRDLASFVEARWPAVVAAIRSAQDTDHVTCKARPPTCRAGGAGEWDPVFHFVFGSRGTGRGQRLVLRAIAIDDEVLVDPDRLAIEHARQASLLTHLAGCP